MSSLKRARRCLRPLGASASVIAAAEYLTALLVFILGIAAQRMLSVPGTAELWLLPLWVLPAAAVCTPVQMHGAWILAETAGVLAEEDIGYLKCSSSIRLWADMAVLRMIMTALLMLSFLPSCFLLASARVVWLRLPLAADAFRPLLTAAHLLAASAGMLWLPLRVYAALLALPFAYLKLTHLPYQAIIRAAFVYSRGRVQQLSARRLLYLPLLLFPVTAVRWLPRLSAAELIEASRGSRVPQQDSLPVRLVRFLCGRYRKLRAIRQNRSCIPYKNHAG